MFIVYDLDICLELKYFSSREWLFSPKRTTEKSYKL